MVLFKACLRCRGDMHINRDIYGEYGKCFQCGFMVDIGLQNYMLNQIKERSLVDVNQKIVHVCF